MIFCSSVIAEEIVSVPHISDTRSNSDAVNSLVSNPTFTANYTNSFFLPEIGLANVGLVYPSKYLNTSCSVSYYGYSEFWNIGATVGFSHYFKKYISIGLEGFFYGCHFNTDAGFKATGGLNLSILAFPTKNLSIGLLAENITFSKLPVVFRLGVGYRIAEKVNLAFEGGIELKQPFFISMDFEYMPVSRFILRCGLGYRTSASASVGFGLRLKGFILDFNVDYRLRSGVGCKASIGFQIKKKRTNEK